MVTFELSTVAFDAAAGFGMTCGRFGWPWLPIQDGGHNRWSLACFIQRVQSGGARVPYQHLPTTLATLQTEE